MPQSSSSPRAHLWGLAWTLVRTDFKTRYHGSLSGLFWALLKPLSMFVVLMAIFSLIFSTDQNYKLNLVVGLFLWDFFAESTKSGLAALHGKGFLLTKAKFPPWILIVASSSNAIIALTVFSVAILAYLGFSEDFPSRRRRSTSSISSAFSSSYSGSRWPRACCSCATAI